MFEQGDLNSTDTLCKYLEEEFSFVSEMKFARNKKLDTVKIPDFYLFLLAAAFSSDKRPVCFVLPGVSDTPLILATLIAFYDIANRFDEFLKHYERTALTKGCLVAVIPTNHVYQYDGMWGEGSFRLKELQESPNQLTASRTFPIDEIVRLESTTAKRPKGKLDRKMGTPELCTLDNLLGVKTYSNTSLFQNCAILAATISVVQKFLSEARFSRNGGKSESLAAILPWGTITENGRYKFPDKYQNKGEPALAIGSRAFNITEATRRSADFSRVVIVPDVRRFSLNLINFDPLLETQKIILFAEPKDASEFPLLEEKGVLIWDLAEKEILIGLSNIENELSEQNFGTVRRARSILKRAVHVIKVEDSNFDRCALHLEKIRRLLKGREDKNEIADSLLQQLYFILLDLASILTIQNDNSLDALRTKLEEYIAEIERITLWIDPETKNLFVSCIDSLKQILLELNSNKLSAKAQILTKFLKDNRGASQTIVVPRTKYGKDDVARFTMQTNQYVSVGDPGVSYYEKPFKTAVLTGWPNGKRWFKIIDSGISENIFLLCYSFEERWYQSFLKYNAYLKKTRLIEAEEKISLLSLPTEFVEHFRSDVKARLPEVETPEEHVQDFSFSIEDELIHVRKDVTEYTSREVREGHYVSFIGDCYAYLTPNHSIAVLTDLLSTGSSDKLRRCTLKDLEIGDIVLFRESAEGNVLREITEKDIGDQAYADLRKNADRWRAPLQKLGADPRKVAKFLQEKGLKKDWQTINNWLYDPDHIGPRTVSDIVSIGQITGEQSIITDAQEIMADIEEVRKKHVQAGHALSDMILEKVSESLLDPFEVETELKLDIGVVWIVTVDYIERVSKSYPAQNVNVLRWS